LVVGWTFYPGPSLFFLSGQLEVREFWRVFSIFLFLSWRGRGRGSRDSSSGVTR